MLAHVCQVCGRGVEAPLMCRGCQAICYCGEKHARRHLEMGHDAEECGRMAAQVQRTQELLASLPFPWLGSAARPAPCAALTALGVHSVGAWRRECPCGGSDAARWGIWAPLLWELWGSMLWTGCPPRLPRPQIQSSLARSGWWGLPPGQQPAAKPPPGSSAAVVDWASYHAWRSLPLGSPVSLLLDVPLTLFWAAGMLPPEDRQGEGPGSRMDAPELAIHLLGPQKELDQWPALLELGALLPRHRITLRLVGPEVPEGVARGGAFVVPGVARPETGAGIIFCFDREHYHALTCGLPPGLVVAPNAGLAAYPEWVDTLRALGAAMAGGGGPAVAVFTDFNEEAALRGLAVVRAVVGAAAAGGACGVTVEGPLLNPFRRPLPLRPADNALPTYSNGWAVVVRRGAAPPVVLDRGSPPP